MSDGAHTLQDSRTELDALDVSLVQVLARGSQVILDVIRYKRANAMAVVDRDGEDRMIEGLNESRFQKVSTQGSPDRCCDPSSTPSRCLKSNSLDRILPDGPDSRHDAAG